MEYAAQIACFLNQYRVILLLPWLPHCQNVWERLEDECSLAEWPSQPWLRKVLESKCTTKASKAFSAKFATMEPSEALSSYFQMLRHCLAHQELDLEGGASPGSWQPLDLGLVSEDIELINMCPLAPSSPLRIVNILQEALYESSLLEPSTEPSDLGGPSPFDVGGQGGLEGGSGNRALPSEPVKLWQQLERPSRGVLVPRTPSISRCPLLRRILSKGPSLVQRKGFRIK